MHHVIIGAGPAGIIAAETMRDISPDAEVTVVGDEPEPPYSRMALPYYLIDRVDERGTYLRKKPSHYDRLKIAVRQDRVTGVDASGKSLTLASGGSLGYDNLLVASGSRPTSPPIPGIDLDGVHPCWTLEDARHIARLAIPGAKVVLMGAGFIGCIILEALASRGVELTVVEMEDRMVPRMMNQTAGGLLKRWCESKGVAVHTSTRAEAIERDGDGKLAVKLADGPTLPADLVITATGVRPNTEFLGGAVDTDVGVLVNDRLQSSQPDIYAAGDVAQGRDFSTGEYSVQAIQPTAADHARLAALNMAGREAVHQGSVNMNVLDTLGLISSSFGLWMGVDGGAAAELCDRERYRYLNLQFQDDVLVGASSLGLTDHVGVLRGLIQSRVRLGAWKDRLLRDPTRVMEAYLASTQAISVRAIQ
jgi:NADPH-dependent 2,4-dienoyl-CoA reductase/sulfur reductase-like enzyme